jgi:serine protease Do
MSDLGTVAETLRRSTVRIGGSGSGVIWKPGVIITNAHVARQNRLKVEVWNGQTMEGVVEKRDPRRDLALLRTPEIEPLVQAGDSDRLRPGQIVIAVGNPLGFVGALSTGVLHGHGPIDGLGRHSWVQADVRLAPGNSGGPLADAAGRVIGINTMIAGRLALAVPSNDVARFLATSSSRVTLGVTLRPIPNLGLLILEVAPDSPAARASLLPGDLLIGIDPAELYHSIEHLDSFSLKFTRGGNPAIREVVVRLRTAQAA